LRTRLARAQAEAEPGDNRRDDQKNGGGKNRRPEAVDPAWLAARAAEREPLYREVADQVIDVDAAVPRLVAAEILARLATPSAG